MFVPSVVIAGVLPNCYAYSGSDYIWGSGTEVSVPYVFLASVLPSFVICI